MPPWVNSLYVIINLVYMYYIYIHVYVIHNINLLHIYSQFGL